MNERKINFICTDCSGPFTEFVEFRDHSCDEFKRQRGADAEIARLRAELDAAKAEVAPILAVVREVAICWSGKTEDVPYIIAAWAREAALCRESAADARRDLSSARAALDKERADVDEALTFMREKGYPRDATDNSHVASWCRRVVARRAAEAKETPR